MIPLHTACELVLAQEKCVPRLLYRDLLGRTDPLAHHVSVLSDGGISFLDLNSHIPSSLVLQRPCMSPPEGLHSPFLPLHCQIGL